MSTTAIRWGLGLAVTGFGVNKIFGEGAHRAAILGGRPAPVHTATPQKLNDLSNPSVKALHIYDHCPYCVRVQLAAGWRDVDIPIKVYGYGDMEGPKLLTGKKILPVLEVEDKSGQKIYLRESLDLVDYLEGYNGEPNRKLPPAGRKDLTAWLKKAKESLSVLTRPRILKMPLEDWKKPEDIAYAVNKYTTRFGFDYAKAEAATDEHLEKMAGYLEELDELLASDEAANAYGRSIDDIVLIPNLRTLTCVKGLRWPKKVKAYVENGCKDAGIETYSAHAV